MKQDKTINKKKIGLIAGGIILLVVLWFVFDRQANKIEYPFKACQGEMCIYGNQMGKIDNCVVTERQERICGDYVLFIREGIEISPAQ